MRGKKKKEKQKKEEGRSLAEAISAENRLRGLGRGGESRIMVCVLSLRTWGEGTRL